MSLDGPADDLSGFYCSHPDCPDTLRRGAGNIAVAWRYGPDRRRLLRCRTCGERFSERRYCHRPPTRLSDEQVKAVLRCLADGLGVRATARESGVAKETAARWKALVGENAAALLAAMESGDGWPAPAVPMPAGREAEFRRLIADIAGRAVAARAAFGNKSADGQEDRGPADPPSTPAGNERPAEPAPTPAAGLLIEAGELAKLMEICVTRSHFWEHVDIHLITGEFRINDPAWAWEIRPH